MMDDISILATAKTIQQTHAVMQDILPYDALVELGNIAHEKGVLETDDNKCNGKQAESYHCSIEHAPFLYPVVVHAYQHIVQKYGFDIDLQLTQDFLLNEYTGPSGEYPWHCDMTSELTSDVKMSCIINASVDKYEGGKFHLAEFGLQNTHMSFLEEPGTGIIFRANTLHKVDPVTSGKRRSLVFFFSGPSWR
jgi:hypothetical protein